MARWLGAFLFILLFIAPVSSGAAEEALPPPATTGSMENRGSAISPAILFPLRVAGTAISPATRTALVVLLDEQGKEVGIVSATEGETVQGYRLTEIQTDRVLFERDGQTFSIRVSHTGPPVPRIVPDLPYKGNKEELTEGRAPADLPEIQKATELMFEKLRENPEFQKQLEDARALLRQKLEGAAPGPSKP